MDFVTDFLVQYSFEAIAIFIIGVALAIKYVGELGEYFYAKIRGYFNIQNSKDKQHNELIEKIENTEKISSIAIEKIDGMSEKIENMENQDLLVVERLQENSRSHIIDKHHYFCYEVHAIDDLNLQSLEREYLYYKMAGGNSFIDGLMEEIRTLPKMNLQNKEIINAIQHFGIINKK